MSCLMLVGAENYCCVSSSALTLDTFNGSVLYFKCFLIHRILLCLANVVYPYGFVIGVFRPFIPVYLLNCLLVGSVFSLFFWILLILCLYCCIDDSFR